MTAYVSGRPPVSWLTCLDDRDHAVKEMIGSSGVYAAVCGLEVLPAASQEPPCERCAGCVRYVRAWAHMRDASVRLGRATRHGRPGVLRRVFCRRAER